MAGKNTIVIKPGETTKLPRPEAPEVMPKKTAMWKDVWRAIAHSKGRFVSIMLLMMLGSFALVGLYVAGPDMRATGKAYFGQFDSADLSVISDYGLDEDDVAALKQTSDIRELEFGYFKDVTVEAHGENESMRIFSAPENISQFELVEGHMPTSVSEIVISETLADEYKIGDTLEVDEKADALSGEEVLKEHSFTIVGFVNSPEILSNVNMGNSSSGSGSLKAYAVATEDTFDSEVFMVARMTFSDTEDLDPYSNEYRDLIQEHKDDIDVLLEDRPVERLATVRAEAQEKIDDGQAEVDDAKQQLKDAEDELADAADQIADAEDQIAEAKNTLATSVADAQTQLDSAALKLADARDQLNSAAKQIADGESQISAAQTKLDQGASDLAAAKTKLESSKAYLDKMQAEYDASLKKFQDGEAAYEANWPTVSAQWEAVQTQLQALNDGIAQCEAGITDCDNGITQLEQAKAADPDNSAAYDVQIEQVKAKKAGVEAQKTELETKLSAATSSEDYQKLKAGYEQLVEFANSKEANQKALDDAKKKLDDGWKDYNDGLKQYNDKKAEYDEGVAKLATKRSQLEGAKSTYNSGIASYNASLETYNAGVAELAAKKADGQAQIDDAESELSEKKGEYLDALDEYNDKKADADVEIADAEDDIAEAKEKMEGLATPVYEVDSRREVLGGEGYATYTSVSKIVDALAKVFPVFLYLVAALVTLSTMTRMVEEERINSGTYKALGYSDKDIAAKFIVYGSLAGGIGTVLGIALGHTLLPYIVYSAYGHAFTLPPIKLEFHWGISLLAVLFAWLCAVLPAILATKSELKAKPAELLLPKAPAGGSKIFLERIGFIWKHLSFTHKVTARNLFRYKQRMFMTILGVAGAACMLVAGFGVQQSIADMGERQFGTLIKYDMIVADNSSATKSELTEIDELLEQSAIQEYMGVHYESASLVAGSNGDRQDITMIVPEDENTFTNYVTLCDRRTDTDLELDDSGVIISERLSTLTGFGVGDTITFDDGSGDERTATISAITEMYMGHFMFMSQEAYESIFGEDYSTNATMVTLKDGSIENVDKVASRFMRLDGVKGVVQNTGLEEQVNTVVDSLDMIMKVLILVATLLGIVIMYNLTNLNVSERMRELSTIKVLGFHTDETVMYIYRETIVLTGMGLVAGWVLGVALHEFILAVVPPDNVMFNPELAAIEFIVPAVVVCAITFVLFFVELRRMHNVDMLEALKSVE